MKMFIVLGFLAIFLLLMTTTQIANATNLIHDTTIGSDNLTDPTITSFSPAEEIAAFNSILGKPFYELTSSNNTGSEVISLNPPVTKDSYSGRGFMQEVGNVTDQGAYVSTYSPGEYISEGKGIIFSDEGQFVTFTSVDTGFTDDEGNFMYRGSMIFDSNDPEGVFSKIDDQIGLYITWSGINGTNWSKTWLWE